MNKKKLKNKFQSCISSYFLCTQKKKEKKIAFFSLFFFHWNGNVGVSIVLLRILLLLFNDPVRVSKYYFYNKIKSKIL